MLNGGFGFPFRELAIIEKLDKCTLSGLPVCKCALDLIGGYAMNVTLNNREFALIRDLLLLERYQITEDLNRRFGKVDAASEQAIED